MEKAKGFWGRTPTRLLALTLALLATTSTGRAEIFTDTLYFTASSSVIRRTFTYDNVAHTLNTGMNDTLAIVPALQNADGIIFTADSTPSSPQLAVGAGPTTPGRVYKIDVNSLTSTSVTTGNATVTAFHVMRAPGEDGPIYSSGYSSTMGGPGSRYNSTLTTNGTVFLPTGGDSRQPGIATLAWTGDDPNHAYYTSSGNGGFGDYGRIDLLTNVKESLLKTSSLLPAAHGMVYDPNSGTLILSGADHVTQIDLDGNILSDLQLNGAQFDNISVDDKDHVYVADRRGNILFLDIANSKRVGTPDFMMLVNVGVNVDDIAPLSGPGSNMDVPEPGSLTLLGLGGLAVLGYIRRRRSTRE
jgi:hypothetical protein